MARALSAAGASVSDAIYPGGHDWRVWYPRLNQMLVRASQDFAGMRVRARAVRRQAGLGPRTAVRKRRDAWSAAPVRMDLPARPARATAPSPDVAPPVSPSPSPSRRVHHPDALLAGLILALLSAAAINLGFLLQHRGLASSPNPARNPLVLLRSGSWLGGQAVGWLGFIAQIIAVALAPLSLVQAFAAGGLALSVPLAARLFRHRVSREQRLAVLVLAFSLASLPIGLSAARGATRTGLLVASSLIVAVLAAAFLRRDALLRAVAAGLFYGVADAAIRAESLSVSAHGAGALLSGWTVMALLGTFAGFLAFQAALRVGNAVSAISGMTAVTALTALGFGLAAFGESLGRGAPLVIVHLIAIALVLACVPLLAGVQQEIAEADAAPPLRGGFARTIVATGRIVGFGLVLVLCVLSGLGLLYVLRNASVLAVGPPVHDSLPLLPLAGFDSQPIALLVAAWLTAGMILGVVSIPIAPLRRAIATGVFGLALLLLASDASFALARNLRFEHVLWHRAPGLGPWVEALLLAAGSALPDFIARARPGAVTRLFTAFARLLRARPSRRRPIPPTLPAPADVMRRR
jgi:hypothetical protein